MATVLRDEAAISTSRSPMVINEHGSALRSLAVKLIYAALGIIFLWFGLMKFTAYEAQGVGGLIANNPLLMWLHSLFGVQGGARVLGVVEVSTGVLILCRWFNPRLSAIGGAMAVLAFILTLSCMFTTPGVSAMEAGGFPVLSGMPGQFLLKDIGLFAASFFIFADSMVQQSFARREVAA